MDNDVNIRIKQTLEGNSLPEVKAQLKAVQSEMNACNRTTAEGATRYKELSVNAGLLTTRTKELGREQRGLDGNLKVSTASALNYGKNISAIGIGLMMAANLARQFAQRLWETAKAGAEFQVMRTHFEKVSGSIKQAADDMDLLKTAVSGNLNEQEIMMFTNKMREMNKTTQESAQVLDFAERMTDKLGGTIEDATAKVFRYIETGKGKGFEQMGVSIALVNQRVEELAVSQGKTTATMEAEELATLRLTVFMDMYGDSIDNIKKKQPELDDKLIASEKNFDNLKFKIGILLAEGLEPTITALGKLATIFDGTASSMKPVDDMLKKISTGLIGTKDLLNALTSPFTTLYNMLTVKLPSAIDILTRSFADISNSLSIIAPSSFLSSLFDMITNVINKVREAVGWLNKLPGVDIKQEANSGTSTWKEAMSGTPSTPSTDKTGSRGSSKNNTADEKEILSVLQQEINKRDELQKSLALNINDLGAVLELTKQIADANERILFLQTGQQPWYKKTVSELGIVSGEDTGMPVRNYKPYEGGSKPDKDLDLAGEKVSAILDVATQTTNILGLGADSFIGKMLSGFGEVLNLADSFISLLMKFGAIGGNAASGGIFGILGGLLGFAEGGLLAGPGTGTSDSILARVSNGEYIVNAQATSQYLPFLNAINGNNSSLSNMFQRYAYGGMVSGGGTGEIKVYINSALEKTKAVRVINGMSKDIEVFNAKKTIG